MRVWLLKIGEPVPQSATANRGRCMMLAEELTRRGHDVLWWVSSFDHQRKRMAFADDVEIPIAERITARTVQGISYQRDFSLSRYFDHRIIARKFAKRAPSLLAPDAIVVSMPDHNLAWEAVSFAKARGIPVIVDIRDPWPEAFLPKVPAVLRPIFRTALWFDFRTLDRTLRAADVITSMASDWLSWGLARAGRPKRPLDSVYYIGSHRTSTAKSQEARDRLGPIIRAIDGKFVVTFIGTFTAVYQPTVVVEAARILANDPTVCDKVAFVLAGDGVYFDQVHGNAQSVSSVHMPGWVDRAEMDVIQATSNVGVVPSGLHTEAFPNKAFGYFAAGLPILSSNVGDLARLLQNFEAGWSFPRGDAYALAALIKRLIQEPEVCQRMAKNARQLFDSQLDAGAIYSAFADLVEEIAGCTPSLPI